ncbi:hypothetical protein Actkin_01006 [Actinokineospora sp. UTMC 2448]|nr:hypothetical protein Actkin_01006 [Actinokineospora sp. UTMC 2448]
MAAHDPTARAAIQCGDIERIEIPRPSRNGELVALRIEAGDLDRLRSFDWP